MIARLEAILDALDALEDEALDDLNAEFEDALMLLSELDPDYEGEDFAETLAAIRSLAGDYRAAGIEPLATEIEKAAIV